MLNYLALYIVLSFLFGIYVSSTKTYREVCIEEGKDPIRQRFLFIIRSPIAIPFIILKLPLVLIRVVKRFYKQTK